MLVDNNRLHTEHSVGVLPEIACLSCPVNLERSTASYRKQSLGNPVLSSGVTHVAVWTLACRSRRVNS